MLHSDVKNEYLYLGGLGYKLMFHLVITRYREALLPPRPASKRESTTSSTSYRWGLSICRTTSSAEAILRGYSSMCYTAKDGIPRDCSGDISELAKLFADFVADQ
jgi:hypothetical protein